MTMAVRALVAVDLQHDFLPRGALAVPDGDAVIKVIDAIMPSFDVVVATQDWHPPDHGSFASNHPGHEIGDVVRLAGQKQVLWPDHCVQGTSGAELHSGFDQRRVHAIVRKGTRNNVDSYSTFWDNARLRSTGLAGYLRELGVTDVWLGGLATDYCVLYSVLDSAELGFATYVVEDACRGIERKPGDVQRAFEAMAKAGARVVTSGEA
jgi:nicotinamidase/pyrazinamidase